MIRSILVFVFAVCFLILSTPLMLAEWIIGKFNMDVKNRSSLAIVNWGFRCILHLAGAKITYLGEDHVPTDEPVLYVANHQSYFDVIATYVRVPRPTGYVAKIEMLKYPLLRNWMNNLHCLFLDRNDLKQGLKTILTCIEKVKSGISICIFPEGTRSKVPDTFLPFKDGSFKVAEKSGCAIIPITINNSAALWENHAPWIRKAHVVIEYGKPIYMKDLSREDKKNIGAYVQNIIKETYSKNKELV